MQLTCEGERPTIVSTLRRMNGGGADYFGLRVLKGF